MSAFAKVPIPSIQDGGAAKPTFASNDDPVYKAMLEIIRQGRRQVLSTPRVDMPGADVIAGKSRTFIPPPVPEIAPDLNANVDDDGVVALSWERSARTIGLSSELHRSDNKDFTPGEKTLVVSTELFKYRDGAAPLGKQYYALILVSGEKKSRPSIVKVKVTPPKPPSAPERLTAKGVTGEIKLAWEGSEDVDVRYRVYRKDGKGEFVKITPSDIMTLWYSDAAVEDKKLYTYTIRAVGGRGIESGQSEPVTAASLPEIKDPIFTADFSKDMTSALYGGGKAEGKLMGAARIKDKTLDLRQGGYATFDHSKEFELGKKVSIKCRVRLDKDSPMPVIVSRGQWQKSGFFLQKLGKSWRWHVAGVNCDGGTPEIGKWFELKGTYDGRTAKLYQDGKLIAQMTGAAKRTPWTGPLYVGQYSGTVDPVYQVNGQISNLEIYHCALTAKEVLGE